MNIEQMQCESGFLHHPVVTTNRVFHRPQTSTTTVGKLCTICIKYFLSSKQNQEIFKALVPLIHGIFQLD